MALKPPRLDRGLSTAVWASSTQQPSAIPMPRQPGIRTNTGSCQLFYYAPADGLVGENSRSTLINKLLKQKTAGGEDGQAAEPEKVKLKLTITESATALGVKHIEGEVYLTVAMTCAVGEVFMLTSRFNATVLDGGCPMSIYMGKKEVC